MSIDWGVSGSASEILAIPVWDVLACLWVPEALGKTEVDNVDVVLLLPDSDQEIVWLNVSVQEMTWVDKFYSLKL